MGERKVLNKYFPPDFDPSLVPRRRGPKSGQIEVRMMLPMSIQCDTCGEYMYRGKKFNSKKENVWDEDYHGIRIYRFYIRCVACSAQITFKTDPKSGDYVTEQGCSRNFEPWRETEAANAAAAAERVEEETGDSMKTLENRTLDSKREMDIIDALDEIRAINTRHARVDTDALLSQTKKDSTTSTSTNEDKADEQDRIAAMQAFSKKRSRDVEAVPVSLKKPATKPATAAPSPLLNVIAVKQKKKKAKSAVSLVSYGSSSSNSSDE